MKLNPEPNINHLFNSAIKMALDTSDKGRPDNLVKNISCPMLITRGEYDPIVSQQDIAELAAIVPNAEIFNILSAGHEALKDQPKVFLEKLKIFLED